MIPIRAYSIKELMQIYRVSRKTMYNWTQHLRTNAEFGWKKHQHIFTPKQVSIIFKELGEPEY
jgi:transposase